MAVSSVGAFVPPQFVLGPINPSDKAPVPTSRQVETPTIGREFNTAPVLTNRPGGAPFHAGGPNGLTVPAQSPGGSPVLTAQPVTGPLDTPNAVLTQAQTNNTEMVGVLLDRFA